MACNLYTLFKFIYGELNVFHSRKHFTEEQAERWWAENGAKTCERHNIRSE